MSTMNSKLTFKRGLELKNSIMMAPKAPDQAVVAMGDISFMMRRPTME